MANDVADAAKIPGVTPTVIEAVVAGMRTAFHKSFQVMFYVAIAFGIISIITAILLDGAALESKLTTSIHRRMQGIVGEAEREKEKEVA
ncbi:hypothetical protein PV08_04878 [Exophiala spinifera]|uniref:Major facilitator superfamily (MFS) profile domain-containing protein n=1 Tax=Exophiala spinifera TaxID=91928 RepID=A0A0D2BFA9_9EURO|nr:uncharacterized protein PV08_04878 [Exophiala spinifera]KIW17683.1 hypothetical protein PV08_04878 [Exophiala spinifera]